MIVTSAPVQERTAEIRKQKEAGGGPTPSDDNAPAEAESAPEAN